MASGSPGRLGADGAPRPIGQVDSARSTDVREGIERDDPSGVAAGCEAYEGATSTIAVGATPTFSPENHMNDKNNTFQQQGHYPQQGYPQGGWQPQPPPKKKIWFLRHKFLTAILALVLIVGFGSAIGGGGSKGGDDAAPSSSSKSETSEGNSDGGSKDGGDALPAVGTPVRDGKFEFTITKVERGKKTVGQQYVSETAQGEYTLVHVTVKNIGDQQQGLSDSDQKAMDASGTQFSADTMAGASIQGNDVLFNQINPGNQVKGVLVFDVPAGTKLTQIELHDSMFSGGVKAAL